MKIDRKLADSFTNNGLQMPVHAAGAIERYLFYGLEPGGFLEAMFSGRYHDAAFKADIENKKYFVDIVKWITWSAPDACKGSRENIIAWIKLTDEQRREILVKNNLAHPLFDIIKKGQDTMYELNN
jgi:hypothetical protein